MRKFIAATDNQGKLKEIREILKDIDIVSKKDFGINLEVEENGETLEENALLKARAICKLSGFPAIADDTGLFVDALGGCPGVRSARYAGENAGAHENNKKILNELMDTPDELRTARFITVMACVYPDGKEIIALGKCEGLILREARGDGGFGYDPVFLPLEPELGGIGNKKSMAELTSQEKNDISHRGRALRELELVGSFR